MSDIIMQPSIFSDLALARRFERAEACNGANFVEARVKAFAQSDAEWIEVAGAYAMYDGPSSPVTQTFGLGLFQTIETTHLGKLEGFFREREAPVFHEVSPLAGISVLRLLNERGYQPVELTSVMYRAIQTGVAPVPPCDDTIRVCQVGESDQERWARIAAEGWSESGELSDFLLDLAKINPHRKDTISFLAEMNGQAIAAAALSINVGVAMLAGACTIPAWRKRGAQAALLYSRLKYAAESGCDIAMMCAGPGTSSQRNAERQGFRIAYTRLKWRLA